MSNLRGFLNPLTTKYNPTSPLNGTHPRKAIPFLGAPTLFLPLDPSDECGFFNDYHPADVGHCSSGSRYAYALMNFATRVTVGVVGHKISH